MSEFNPGPKLVFFCSLLSSLGLGKSTVDLYLMQVPTTRIFCCVRQRFPLTIHNAYSIEQFQCVHIVQRITLCMKHIKTAACNIVLMGRKGMLSYYDPFAHVYLCMHCVIPCTIILHTFLFAMPG